MTGTTITSVSASVAVPGNTVTVSGSGFDPVASRNIVGLNTVRTKVLSATPTSLSLQVPSPATAGHFTVMNVSGTAVSSADLFVPPSGFAASDVQVATRVAYGASTPVSISTSGKIALLVFDGTAGQRISVQALSSSMGNEYITIRRPDGSNMYGPSNLGGNWFIDAMTLSATGTYTVVVDPLNANTGTITLRVNNVPADLSGTITLGTSFNVSIGTPGQNASYTFSGTAGQRISVQNLNSQMGNQAVTIRKPDGTNLYSHSSLGGTWFIDTLTLPATGTYTLVIDPLGTNTGTITLRVNNVPADLSGTITLGTSFGVSIGTPGQNAAYTFSGTAGQRISVQNLNSQMGNQAVTIRKPDGTNLYTHGSLGGTWFIDTLTLPTTGTYTLVIDPLGTNTGTITLRVNNVPYVTATITIGGASVPVSLPTPGQDGLVYFNGTSGQALTLVLSSVTISQSNVSIQRPDGSNLVAPTLVTTTGKTINATPNVTGTYTIVINPTGTNTGSMTLTLTSQGGAISGPVLAAAPVPVVGDRDRVSGFDHGGPLLLSVVRPPEPAAVEANEDGDPEAWTPGPGNRHGDWTSGRPPSEWQLQDPLTAPDGTTAVSGIVLDLRGRPIRGATLEIEGVSTTTDATGRFLLLDPPVGLHEFVIDGSTVLDRPGRTYGFFETRIEVVSGTTTILPYTIWLPVLDTANTVRITNPTTEEVILTHPAIPGLEVHIPRGSTVEGEDEALVERLGITPIPVDRPPFPLPNNVVVPVYFTVQPGGAYVEPYGAWIVYPNYTGLAPTSRTDFWQYDPGDDRGWFVYGQGTVTADGAQVAPDRRVRVYEFAGAMMNGSGLVPPATGPEGGETAGDPVDLATGLFVNSKTDLVLPGIMPLAVTRTYRQNDTASRPFGRGTNWNYGMFLWSANQYQEADLILPSGQRIHYIRTSAGTGWTDAAFASTSTPGPYFRSTIVWNGNGWDLRLRDGTLYVFGDNAPLAAIRDANGNQITITRQGGNPNGNITRVSAPHGRWIDFTYDGSNRVATATDNIGRTVTYTYDAAGYLWKVTDPASGVTEYLYNAAGRMTSIKDARGITFLTNTYDANGRVSHQDQADGSNFDFAYALSGSTVTQTDVTDERGFVRRVTFDSSGLSLTDTAAYGTAMAQTTTYVRQAGTGLVTSVTDALGRRTDLTYDASGNVTSVTRLAGTAAATTTTMTYQSSHSRLASITDPLDHTTTFTYDAKGNLKTATDARGKTTTFTYDPQGNLLTVTDATSKTTTFTYFLGDLVAITDPGGNISRQLVDAAGRTFATIDPEGGPTTVTFDALNRPTSVVDPIGGTTSFTYDANGNVLTVTDPRGGVTTHTYDSMDRLATREDPLTHLESYDYDPAGNLLEHTDRKGHRTAWEYDALGRMTFVGYDKVGSGETATYESSTSFTYDAANRLLTAVDSTAGTLTFGHDDFDRLTSETSPQGTMTYAYDAADRRTAATLMGQAAVEYGYDVADRLTSITQAGAIVGYTYDDAGRPLTMTYPSGLVATYAYDGAMRLSGIAYQQGATVVGDLAYGLDKTGRRTSASGTLAGIGLPAAMPAASYDAANRLTSWNGTSLTYDMNGNLTADGSSTFTWNARGELTAMTGAASATFAYDGSGRRISKTITGATTGFAYDGANAIQETTGGVPSANILTGGIDRTLRRSDGSGDRYLLTDALGSAVALVDGSGTIQTGYTYEPYGATGVTGTASTNPSQFTGRENDSTGLYYYRARYYSPTYGRFISEDPAGFGAGDPNLYRYVGNDPVNATDPSGMFGFLAGCAVGAAVDAIFTVGFNAVNGRKTSIEEFLGSAVNGCVAGLLGVGLGRLMAKALGPLLIRIAARTTRMNPILPAFATNPALKNAITKLFQTKDIVPGGTASAIRHEIGGVGQLLSPNGHFIKANNAVTHLGKILSTGRLDPVDKSLAEAIILDLVKAFIRVMP